MTDEDKVRQREQARCIPDDDGVAICCVIDDIMFVALGLSVRCLRLRVGA